MSWRLLTVALITAGAVLATQSYAAVKLDTSRSNVTDRMGGGGGKGAAGMTTVKSSKSNTSDRMGGGGGGKGATGLTSGRMGGGGGGKARRAKSTTGAAGPPAGDESRQPAFSWIHAGSRL